MSPALAFERRLSALLLLLFGLIPLLLHALPNSADQLVVPLLLLSVAFLALLLPIERRLQVGITLLGIGSLLVSAFVLNTAQSFALLFLFPLTLRVLQLQVSFSFLFTGVFLAGFLFYTSTYAQHQSPLQLFAFSNSADVVGLMALLGLSVWIGVDLILTRIQRTQRLELMEACQTLDQSITRDRTELLNIANRLASPQLEREGVVQGQGLHATKLHVATRLDAQHILLACIHGDPLETLSAAWAIRASAQAGMQDPADLIHFAHTQLDEICAPSQITWIGIYNQTQQRCQSAPVGALLSAPAGNAPLEAFESAIGAAHNKPSIDQLFDAPTPVARPTKTALRRLWLADLFLACALPLCVLGSSFFIQLHATQALLLTSFWIFAALTLQWAMLRRQAQALTALEGMERRTDDRIECHDEIHHRCARLHGGLLPYQVHTGAYQATAHRLRGPLLDGSFADMLVDEQQRARIFSGEVRGQGIAARFLGMEAQYLLRTALLSTATHTRSWSQRIASASLLLKESAQKLEFPLNFTAGLVSFDPTGVIHGEGSLVNLMVMSSASDSPSIASQTTITDSSTIYLSPSASLSGPEEDTPTLASSGISKRVLEILASDSWQQEQGSLASLFSQVFDGHQTPSHGILIQIQIALDHRTGADHRPSFGLVG